MVRILNLFSFTTPLMSIVVTKPLAVRKQTNSENVRKFSVRKSIFHFLYAAAADDSSFSVSQAPKETTVSRGGNITFYCIFHIFQPQAWVRVLWWKHGENEFLHSSPDKRKRFGMGSKGSGFFRLVNATFQDSGIYHCTVFRPGVGRGNGTGSHLIVHAAPTPLNLVSRTTEGNSTASLTLVCETAAFYPENFTLTWYKNGVETASGIHTSKVQNREGLYEVSSTLVEIQPVPKDVNYTCLVSHVTLKTPAIVVYTIPEPNRENIPKLLYSIPVCALVGLSFLVLAIVITRRQQMLKNEGYDGRLTGGNRSEELTQQKEVGNDLIYSRVALTGSDKGKANERCTEYAQLRRAKQNGVKETGYMEAKNN
ncbi:tyrosine-protein phosphatase non-receptor type substrate 1-like [Mustelus asterias]